MESREALKRIKREAGTPYFSTLYDIDMWREDFKTIADDLDMLELIKKHLLRVPSIGPNGNEYNDIILVMPNDYVEEAKKIERWLLQQWEAEKKKSLKITSEAELKSLIEFVEEYASKEELTSPIGEHVNKLGQLEDIEEELGIDLITLFKALKYGVYYFANGVQLTKDYVGLIDNYMGVGAHEKLSYSFITGTERQILSFKDYGKTWALTKEELEK